MQCGAVLGAAPTRFLRRTLLQWMRCCALVGFVLAENRHDTLVDFAFDSQPASWHRPLLQALQLSASCRRAARAGPARSSVESQGFPFHALDCCLSAPQRAGSRALRHRPHGRRLHCARHARDSVCIAPFGRAWVVCMGRVHSKCVSEASCRPLARCTRARTQRRCDASPWPENPTPKP